MKQKFPIYLSGESLFSNSQKAFTFENSKKLGEIKNGKIIYSPFEAFYLLEEGKADIIHNNKPLKDQELMKIFTRKDKEFSVKYLVFKNLRKKGYIVKTGLKFGTEFRVYAKNEKHARWLVFPTASRNKINWQEFVSKNRIAHSTGKKMLIAIADSEQDISYYEISWLKI